MQNHSNENDFDLHEKDVQVKLIFIWMVSHEDSF